MADEKRQAAIEAVARAIYDNAGVFFTWDSLAPEAREMFRGKAAALLDRIAPLLAPRAKPLVWEGNVNPCARSIVGDYVIFEWARGPQLCFSRWGSQTVIDDFPTVNAAEDAAQADYERRILAALEGGE